MYCTTSSPKKINIDPSSYTDLFYRYKMPQLQILYQKNFTILNNLADVSKALHVKSNDLIKYIANTIGTMFNTKKNSLSGVQDVKRISDIVIKFIETYVLCEVCGLPELVTDKDSKSFVCNSCGHSK